MEEPKAGVNANSSPTNVSEHLDVKNLLPVYRRRHSDKVPSVDSNNLTHHHKKHHKHGHHSSKSDSNRDSDSFSAPTPKTKSQSFGTPDYPPTYAPIAQSPGSPAPGPAENANPSQNSNSNPNSNANPNYNQNTNSNPNSSINSVTSSNASQPQNDPEYDIDEEDEPSFPMPQYGSFQADRYGFEKGHEEAQLTPEEVQLRKKESEKETEREVKWIDMLRNWGIYSTQKLKKLESRVLKGIPDPCRAVAWANIIDPEARRPGTKEARPPIQAFLDQGKRPCCTTIDVDLARTMPQVQMFTEKKSLISLRRILYAYSNCDPELGYTQGMGFYAAQLLFYMDEVTAFWCFKALMADDRYGLRYYFKAGFPRLHAALKVWGLLLKKKYKRIFQHFEAIELQQLQYAMGWFLCAFQTLNFPPQLRLMMFDRWVMFKTRSIMSFGLTIIEMNKELCLTGEMDSILPVLQFPDKSPQMKDWREVLRVWDTKWISEADYRSLFAKAEIEYFP